MPAPARSSPARPRRPDESMSLLADVATHALDPGYAHAAERRRGSEPGDGARAKAGSPWTAVAILLATLLVVVAARQALVRAPAAAKTRSDLVAAVRQQSAAVDRLTRQVGDLRNATAQLRDRALESTASGAELARRLRGLEAAAGLVAVSGPGLRVTVDDTHVHTPDDRVQDRDLQGVVNALWAAGAEAVAVNGERLTGQSAIREAGDAILANFQPLSAPYVISAVGDPAALETGFATSRVSDRLRSYAQLYGLRFSYARQSALHLPPATGETLHYAKPASATGGR